MIALHSDCILLESVPGECTPIFQDDVSQEMLGIQADPDYFKGAVEAVFAYIHQKEYQGKLSLEELSDLVATALITPPGKLTRHICLPELMRTESLLGELEFFTRLKEVLQSLKNTNANLIFVEGIRNCVLTCLHRQRWSKQPKLFAESVIDFIRQFSKQTLDPECVLVIQ